MDIVIKLFSIFINVMLIVAIIYDLFSNIRLHKLYKEVNENVNKDIELNNIVVDVLNEHSDRLRKLEKGE